MVKGIVPSRLFKSPLTSKKTPMKKAIRVATMMKAKKAKGRKKVAVKPSSSMDVEALLGEFMKVTEDTTMALKLPKGLVMANLSQRPKYDRTSFSSKEEAFKSWEQDIARLFEMAYPIKVKDAPLCPLDRRYDPFATGYNFDLFGLDSSLDLEDLARQIVDSKAISAQAYKEAKKMAYSVFYLWSRAQAQLYDLLKSEFGKSERSLINEYQRSVQQEKLIERRGY